VPNGVKPLNRKLSKPNLPTGKRKKKKKKKKRDVRGGDSGSHGMVQKVVPSSLSSLHLTGGKELPSQASRGEEGN